MVKSCVTPQGFVVGVHKPSFEVANLRLNDYLLDLGRDENNHPVTNQDNFPDGDVAEKAGKWIYEIVNPFPFRGATFIDSGWAKERVDNPDAIRLPPAPSCSLRKILADHLTDEDKAAEIMASLPKPLLYDLAANSTDGEELVLLAKQCCDFIFAVDGTPLGLRYTGDENPRLKVVDFELFETIANNPCLPDSYKRVMVLRPGVQGKSEVVGEYKNDSTHVFEYLRRNSYIPWGHYAANMAPDTIRYQTTDLTLDDMNGMRHLYYQRVFVSLAEELGLGKTNIRRRSLTVPELDDLRQKIEACLLDKDNLAWAYTLWGWNYGYDFSGSGYRLHASHQMIHQQYGLVPDKVASVDGGAAECYSCGGMVADVVAAYRGCYQRDFFVDYLAAIRNNTRVDGNTKRESSLVVYEDEFVMIFVPKAQVSQWELQLMVLADGKNGAVGNILEAEGEVRAAIDKSIWLVQKIYAAMGAKMVTSFEYGKRFGLNNGQRLIYSFMPKLPWAMGGFSEAQQRYICGHFPEDFARACRLRLLEIN